MTMENADVQLWSRDPQLSPGRSFHPYIFHYTIGGNRHCSPSVSMDFWYLLVLPELMAAFFNIRNMFGNFMYFHQSSKLILKIYKIFWETGINSISLNFHMNIRVYNFYKNVCMVLVVLHVQISLKKLQQQWCFQFTEIVTSCLLVFTLHSFSRAL